MNRNGKIPLSDPEKHAQLIKDNNKTIKLRNSKSDYYGSIHRSSSDNYNTNNNNNKKSNHNKSNTIFGALSSGIGSKSKYKNKTKTHRKIVSHMNINMNMNMKNKNMKGKNAFFVNANDSEWRGKSDDPNWSIPDSPLFSWLTEYISRPLTNAMRRFGMGSYNEQQKKLENETKKKLIRYYRLLIRYNWSLRTQFFYLALFGVFDVISLLASIPSILLRPFAFGRICKVFKNGNDKDGLSNDKDGLSNDKDGLSNDKLFNNDNDEDGLSNDNDEDGLSNDNDEQFL